MTLVELLASLTSPPWGEIGTSIEGRPLLARSWPGGTPPVLLFGAIHGHEPLGSYCLRWMAEELDVRARAGALPRETWILPVTNPDGFLAGRQNNSRNVDLNRNWPAINWASHQPSPSEPRTPNFATRAVGARASHSPGASPASEPETQALQALIARTGATRLIALHSPFRTVNYDGPSLALAERMAAHNGYGASADIGYPTPGSFGSYYGVDQQLEVITLEIPPMSPEQAWQENRAALYEAIDVAV